jgi:hypothetical protein
MVTYAAPAHIISQLFHDSEAAVTARLSQALLTPGAIPDPTVRQSLESALEFMRNDASLLMGYALRSLGTSYNNIAQRRRDNVLREQPAEVKNALNHIKPGFDSFFAEDIKEHLARAQTSQNIRLSQAALQASVRLAQQPRHFPGRANYGGPGSGRGNSRDYRRAEYRDRQGRARGAQHSQHRPHLPSAASPQQPRFRQRRAGPQNERKFKNNK